jgi:hypothetical protein
MQTPYAAEKNLICKPSEYTDAAGPGAKRNPEAARMAGFGIGCNYV